MREVSGWFGGAEQCLRAVQLRQLDAVEDEGQFDDVGGTESAVEGIRSPR
jgi:hypothetical protein